MGAYCQKRGARCLKRGSKSFKRALDAWIGPFCLFFTFSFLILWGAKIFKKKLGGGGATLPTLLHYIFLLSPSGSETYAVVANVCRSATGRSAYERKCGEWNCKDLICCGSGWNIVHHVNCLYLTLTYYVLICLLDFSKFFAYRLGFKSHINILFIHCRGPKDLKWGQKFHLFYFSGPVKMKNPNIKL